MDHQLCHHPRPLRPTTMLGLLMAAGLALTGCPGDDSGSTTQAAGSTSTTTPSGSDGDTTDATVVDDSGTTDPSTSGATTDDPATSTTTTDDPTTTGASDEPRCAIDGDGDDVLTLDDYINAAPMSLQDCADAGGAVVGEIAGVVKPAFIGDPDPQHDGASTSVDADAEIPQEVLDAVLRSGIPDREYVEDTYDCDDFARDLEMFFEELYGAGAGTFTYTDCPGGAHAITDLHVGGAGGPIAWIEPQTGQRVDLDGDGDGQVTYATDFSRYPEPTDGDCFIAVFDSAAAAEAAGLELD